MGNASETFLLVSRISKDNDFLMGTLYTIFGVLSVLGNGILLFVAYRKKSSLKPAEFFVVNLAISDLGMTITLFPLAIPSAFAHMWLFNQTVCIVYAFCGVLFGLCSLTNLTVLSCVCWLKVCCPNYGNKFSYCHACLLVACIWCYAGAFAVGPLSGWGEYGAEPYGTACCINWHAPSQNPVAMSYIICLFFFCYIVPCTVIFLSYTFILLTVRGSRQAVQQHMSPQNKITNAHALIVKLSVAVCIGFLTAWSPYAIVSMWAAFGNPATVPPMAFALAAIFAKSSTLYNPIVYLVFKPNFRKSLCRDVAQCRRTLCGCLCQRSSTQKGMCRQSHHKEECNSTRLSNGLPENHRTCRHCPCPETATGTRGNCTDSPQQTARILKGSQHSEVAVSQLSNEMQSDFL
ncbi:opsin 7, group member b [Amphiprion ocellaris]|uniref:G-protein coupled receptors family 1 profile domain-containing protein n=2 Tax=Amphiprion TaxID=80969 RepID=A0A3Q1APG9_AMPOC|nr:opsin 7, group member b [Amphiprion ocellaris]XP_054869065.1 opsin 7, group member b [Amphiprion ocellaris]XP_054869066.1 opsin 7, group member b [Amphiprion ocellaris]